MPKQSFVYVTYIRTTWGNRGTPVSAREANELRSAPLN